jgi:hypothetical protein
MRSSWTIPVLRLGLRWVLWVGLRRGVGPWL